MSAKTVCPNMNSPEWKSLVEMTGDFNDAYAMWEQNEYDYPSDVILDVEMNRAAGLDSNIAISPRTLESKRKLDNAREVLEKRVAGMKRNPHNNDNDFQDIADIEAIIHDIANLDTAYAVQSYVDTVASMAAAAMTQLENIKSGKREPTLKQLYRIRELESLLELVSELLPELEAGGPEFADAVHKAKIIIADKSLISKERLFQQRRLLTKEYAPRVGVIDAFYREKAEREFNEKERKDYNSKEEVEKAREAYITQYMIDTADKRKAETEQHTMDVFSKIEDIAGIETTLINPKDLDSEVIKYATEILDRIDVSIREEVMEEARVISDLRDKYVEYVKGSVESTKNPEKLYDPILEKDEDGNLTGRYINPESPNGQYAELRRNYLGTPVMTLYTHLLDKQEERDASLPKRSRLGYNLPRKNKTVLERVQAKGTGAITETITDIYKLKDTDELGELEEIDEATGQKIVMTSESGKVVRFVPVHYRSKTRVTLEDMSYDVATLAVIDQKNVANFREKTEAAITLNTLMDVVAGSEVTQKEGLKTLVKKVRKKITGEETSEALTSGEGSNVHRALDNIIQGRIYGVGIEGSKELAHRTNQVKRFSSFLNIGGNVFSAGANFLQGSLASWIESFGGKSGLFSAKNRLNGAKKYDADVKEMILDTNRSVPQSKTNLFLTLYNQNEDFNPLRHEFGKTNAAARFGEPGVLYLPQGITERAIQAMLMYSIMDNVKVKNSDGKFIKIKDGVATVVETREEASGYDEAYEVKDGQLVKHPDAASTERTPDFSQESRFIISNLFSRTSRDLFGNYNGENKSIFKRTIIGNLVQHMRDWFLPGIMKRYKGAGAWKTKYGEETIAGSRYNREVGELERGTYIEVIRFFSNLIQNFKTMKMKAVGHTYNQTTQKERRAFKRVLAEWSLILGALMLANLMDDDDEDPVMAYFSRRMYQEFGLYSNPIELLKMTESPMISAGLLRDTLEVGYQATFGGPTAEYTSGNRKGDSKLWKEVSDVVPLMKQLNKNVKDQYSFLTR